MPDPIDLKALQGQVKYLVEDLRGQVAATAGLRSALLQEYAKAKEAERTAGTFESWLEDILDQAAVAWVLGCVFVRFCEDNELVDQVWIGGPEPHASADRAVQNRQAYLIRNPRHSDRDWLREAFGHLAGLRATGQIFDEHNQVWRFDISGTAAEGLSDFFRRGAGFASLRMAGLDTRFLGDLYERLSMHAKKAYALLQTPRFVEEFILDRAFEPAVREFGLAATSVIDPTCGSGHFLLGAFHRLVDKWREREPATDIAVIVERALGQVTGVDINPFAVAIARFRLLVAAMMLRGIKDLRRTPAWRLRIATGDSLLDWGHRSRAQGDLIAHLEEKPVFAYESEDADLLKEFLKPGQYTVVVGNPPYITVSDPARNQLYRSIYPEVCYRQYALTVPFAQRFFELAKRGDNDGDGAGYVGQITGNAFMKREFGKRLIEKYLAHEVELTEVIDTSGAYIPGHGTPTVILVGRNRMVSPRYSIPIRTVLGVRGEPSTPDVPADGLVWKAIESQIDKPGSESDWVSVTDLPRARLATHPWSLSGGGASNLLEQIETATLRLSTRVAEVGFGAVTREDSAYMVGERFLQRTGVSERYRRPLVEGEVIRDWTVGEPMVSIWPYDEKSLDAVPDPSVERILWPRRAILVERVAYGETQIGRGLTWFEYSMFFRNRYRVPLSIAFPDIATHNHFVLDRGGRVFNRTAPVIKLSEEAAEDEHLRLLGVLNSSTACFWLKQVCFPKGGSGIGRGIQPEAWMERYAFNASNVERFPLPREYPLDRARQLDELAQRLSSLTPAAVAASGVPTRQRLAEAEADYHATRAKMIALQEELDWEVYRLYGLIDDDLTCADPPGIALGERAFEIVLARDGVQTEWFARHRSKKHPTVPEHLPPEYRELVNRRIAAIDTNRHIALIERPEHKRRWQTDSWDEMRKAALRDWLLDRLESPDLWGDRPQPQSVAQLADRVRHDAEFREVLDQWVGHPDHDLTRSLSTLVADEHVPYLPAHRYKPSGLRKRAQWERTWALQRREDAGEKVEIPVPEKYTSADFVRHSYWKARGKLDVPKERFISYPRMGRDGDDSELLGWAGWDHLAQAEALATVYLDRRTQARWPADRLLPLLAGLLDLEPWLHQWHNSEEPDYPAASPAAFFTDFINAELARLSSDRAALKRLRGVPELP